MALIKKKNTKFGDSVNAEYWRIGKHTIDSELKKTSVRGRLDGYVNKNARIAESSKIDCMTFEFSVNKGIENVTKTMIYNQLKDNEKFTKFDFSDAIDDID